MKDEVRGKCCVQQGGTDNIFCLVLYPTGERRPKQTTETRYRKREVDHRFRHIRYLGRERSPLYPTEVREAVKQKKIRFYL